MRYNNNLIMDVYTYKHITWASNRDISSSASLLPTQIGEKHNECTHLQEYRVYTTVQVMQERVQVHTYHSMLVVQIQKGVTRKGGVP